ncbi:L-threonine O-3-phosphate decarboxylase [Novosphingobium sp. PhB165]|uniref:threonine-phosphate decarboxylase n=1 Tax=Novosphingobium sp. PhB165 TaxID=2485105 RepID=UPI0010E81BC4|nr:threonine-phosphate decarboxylase [Novosphingobium sp. PhB165]TCM17685.1 L-threonine O-3-phosphate decarboxylase [Novosphingobium sp. PhB165]
MIARFLHHGGRVAEAARLFGGVQEGWLDLSTGLNPVPWPIPPALTPDWSALPDPDGLARLETVAARHFGVDPALCCAVPGSETALRLLGHVLGLPGRALVPCYRSHVEAFAESRPVRFGEEPAAPEVVVMANPNNPDGAQHARGDVVDWAERIERQGGWLIVDEAFADCRPETSVADAVDGGRLIVLRSFGKFFGLAGLRLGFVLAPPEILSTLRALMGSWPLHTAALTIGAAAYGDIDWIARTRQELPPRAAKLDAVLRRHDLEPRGDCPLFRLVTGCAAGEVFERLARARILVRPFEQFPDWLRFGVPADAAALARLDAALGHG